MLSHFYFVFDFGSFHYLLKQNENILWLFGVGREVQWRIQDFSKGVTFVKEGR